VHVFACSGCVQINQPASFAVQLGKAKGPLDARVVAPSGAEDQATVQEIDEGMNSFEPFTSAHDTTQKRNWHKKR